MHLVHYLVRRTHHQSVKGFVLDCCMVRGTAWVEILGGSMLDSQKLVGSRPVVPNLFCSRAIYSFLEGMAGHKVIFSHSCPPLSYFQQLWGLGERCKLLQWGLGRSPSWQRILEHSMAKSDRFRHVARDFLAFKATRNFSISSKNQLFSP